MTELNSVPSEDGSDPAPIASDHNAPMRVEMVPTASLKIDPESVRTFSRDDLKSAKRILKRFDVRIPLVVDAANRVLIGEILLIAAGELEIDYLPIVRLDHLSRLECQAISVAYARLGELGSFDQPRLKELMLRFEAELPSFELEDLGFQTPMIDVIMESELEEQDEALPEREEVAVSQLGDLWDLGPHRVLNADARRAESYAALLQSKKVQAVFTDPPFGCPVDGFVSSKGKHREFAGGTSGMTPDETTSLFEDYHSAMVPHLAAGAAVLEVIDWRSLLLLQQVTTKHFGPLINLAVWVKDRAGQGSFLRSQHELVLIHKAKGGRLRNNVQLGRFGRNRSNVWSYPSAVTAGKGSDEGNILDEHPTPKPVRLVADALLDTTRRGDAVLDPFLGSGTTLIAAEKVGRVCFGLELDPLYVDLIIRRFQAWSGVNARHAITGELFDDRAATLTSA
ncbi:MAG TPA: DNA modification methylase [Sphingomicrobium sp.]|nr:DNA modification methylase [Sphingomicrobium sp.]